MSKPGEPQAIMPSVKALVGILMVLITVAAAPCRLEAADDWWGTDKALHLTVGLGIGAAPYGGLWALDAPREAGYRLLLCNIVGQLPGLGKEFYDAAQPDNYFSSKDLLWSAVGVLVGSLIVFTVDKLTEPEESLSSSSPTPTAGRWGETSWAYRPALVWLGR